MSIIRIMSLRTHLSFSSSILPGIRLHFINEHCLMKSETVFDEISFLSDDETAKT